MAKHRRSRKHTARRAALAGMAAAGLSTALVLGQTADTTPPTDVTLVSAVIGVGGRADPTSTRLRDKLGGDFALAFDDSTYVPIQYPANLLFQSSVDDGAPKLSRAIVDAEGNVRVVSYSEGTLVAERVKRSLPAPVAGDPKLDFVFIASPYLPNGGIFARFSGFQIPGLLPVFGPAQPSPYDSTYVTNEYDGFADFPAYLNPLSVANALLGMVYAHPDAYYDGIKLDDQVEGQTKFTKDVPNNGAGGHDTYVLVYNPHLPLFAPVRQIASLLMLTPLTEPVLSAIEPLVRVAVDMGYTDRTNANPTAPTALSPITPPAKVLEAAAAVPGAVKQGVTDAISGGGPPAPEVPAGNEKAGSEKPTLAAVPDTPAKPVPPVVKPSNPLKTLSGELRGRITHPTVIADGNISTPGIAVSTAPSGGDGETASPEPVSVPAPVKAASADPAGPSDSNDGADAGGSAAAA